MRLGIDTIKLDVHVFAFVDSRAALTHSGASTVTQPERA